MEICVLNPYFYPQHGGTENVLLEIYKRLAKRNNVTLITSALQPGDKERKEWVNGIKVVRLETKRHMIPGLPLPFLEMRRLSENIVASKADICHINNRYQYFHQTIRTIKRHKKKLALTIHNALPQGINLETDSIGYLYDVCWGRELMGYSDVITAVSGNVMQTTIPKKYHHKSCVIPNGVDNRRFRHRDGRAVKTRINREMGFKGRLVLNTARLVHQKGQAYLIRAVGKIVRDKELDDPVNLLIIGMGPLRDELYNEARKAGIGNNFAILDSVGDGIQHYYNAADAYSMPSLYEPASIAVLEAMASETPLVASAVGGIPEIVEDGGLYSRCRDVKGIAKGLAQLLGDRKYAAKLAARARKLAVSKHDWDDIAVQYGRRFEETIRY